MSLSRPEGYRLARGKEDVSLDVFRGFLMTEFGLDPAPIEGAEDNYRFGDFRLDASTTIEVKGQPIDPYRYEQNFVEIFEVTHNPMHADGFSQLASHLQMSPKVLSCVSVRDVRAATRAPLGHQKRVSVSITSMTAARWTAYVNALDGGTHIYLYDQAELLGHIRRGVRRGFVRGAGNSNEDTFGMFIPVPVNRWERRDGDWIYTGTSGTPVKTLTTYA
jgi:hypothetical protein